MIKTTTTQKLGSFYSWSVVSMLWVLLFLNYADRQAICGIFPALEQEFGFSKFQLGLIGSMFIWVYAAAAFFAGFLSDHAKRKPFILGGCLFWSLVTMGTSICSKFWHFLVVRGLEGMGEAFYFPSANSLIADYHTEEKRSTALAAHQSGVYMGTIAGSWLGGWLAEYYGWQYGFYFFGGLGVIVSILLFFFLKEPRRLSAEQKNRMLSAPLNQEVFAEITEKESSLSMLETLFYLLKRPVVVLLVLSFMSSNVVTMIFLTWMPTFLYEKFHMTLPTAGFFAVAFIQLSSALSALGSGWISDQCSRHFQNGRVVMQFLCLLLGGGAIFFIGSATKIATLLVAMIFFGICKGGYDAGLFSSLFDYVEPKVRGSASGFLSSCGYFGGALGPVIVGAVTTYGGAHSGALNRMSMTIASSAGAYGVAALLLLAVLIVTRVKTSQGSTTEV
ncbi:MAG: MFS transporter [Chthoniobacterales bacterium]